MNKLFSAFLLILIHLSLSLSCPTWDFECGCLQGWSRTGTAFSFQPTYKDNPTARNRGQPSKHQGGYWIGGYEKYTGQVGNPGDVQGDGPQGTMTSQTFRIYSRYISFLIGGGCGPGVRLELLVDGVVRFSSHGNCHETMERKKMECFSL